MLGANFIELVKWSAQYFRLSWVEGCCYIGSWERIKIWNLEFGISSSVIFLVTPKKKFVILMEIKWKVISLG